MLNKIIALSIVAALAALLTPSQLDAWGAAHASYTHVGPGGVYHASRPAVGGPGAYVGVGGVRANGATFGGVYRAGYTATAGYAAPIVPPIVARYPGRTVSSVSYTY